MLRQLPTNLRKNSSPVRELSVSTAARQGHLFRPLPLMQRVAGAKAIPDARRADGAPQQARTSPRPQAGEGSRRRPTRHAADGVQPNSRDYFRSTEKRGVRGCRGCRGAAAPLTPCPAPGRRPAARAGQQPQGRGGQKMKQIKNAAAAGKGIHARWGQGSVFRPTKQICCAGGYSCKHVPFFSRSRRNFLL